MLSQRIKLFVDFGKLLFAMTDDTGRSFLEWLLGWNAIEPALLGELLVAGEIEPHKQIHFAIRGWVFFGGFRFLGFVLSLGFCLRFLGFRCLRSFVSMLWSGLVLVLGAFELVLQLFVQAKGLLPAFELLAR